MRMRRRGERGSITPFVIIVAIALLFLAALVIDGSRQLSARARAIAYAEEAARAGAQKINLEQGFVQLLQDDAYAAVDEYCGVAMAKDDHITSCRPTGIIENTDNGQVASLTVEVEVEYNPILLDLFTGSAGTLVSGEATAHPIEGILEPELGEFTPPPPVVDTHPVDPGISTGTTGPTIEVPSPTPKPTCRPPGEPPPPKKKCKTDGTETPPTGDPPTQSGGPGGNNPGGGGGGGN